MIQEFPNLTVRRWSEEEFASSRDIWQKLLYESGSNRLFLSWGWMHLWWQTRGGQQYDELAIFAAYIDGALVGLAPLFYSRGFYFKRLISTTRLQFLGKRHADEAGLRAEYLNFICSSELEQPVIDILLSEIAADGRWHELFFSDIAEGGALDRACKKYSISAGLYLRLTNIDTCYSVQTVGNFKAYLADLGKNIRLKIFNRRSILYKLGAVTIENIDSSNLEALLNSVNDFHLVRFNSLAFTDLDKYFLKSLVNELDLDDRQISSSIVMLNGKVISGILNFRVGSEVYNIQLGFREKIDKKISLGTLHIGFAIEQAFEDPSVMKFDLLAGNGKTSDYKSHFSIAHCNLVSNQLLRRPFIKLLFRSNDKFLSRIKSKMRALR